MAKVYKFTTYIVDPDSHMSGDEEDLAFDFSAAITNKYDCFAQCSKVEMSKDFEWDDNLLINRIDCAEEDIQKYLQYEPIICDCYHTRVRKEPRYNTYTGKIDYYIDVLEHYCTGTRECDLCDCNGDKRRCSHYTYKDGHLI